MENDDILKTNVALAESLVRALEDCGGRPHVLFSSSTHCEGDTAYGRSKRNASQILSRWSEQAKAPFTNMILPHVFGEHGRPFYNSVVSTFCHQLANGEQPAVHKNSDLELLHTQDLSGQIVRFIEDGTFGELRLDGKKISVSELLLRLESLAEPYRIGVIPDLRESFDLQLFNSYRSYLFPDAYPVELERHSDDRGSLVEAVKTGHGGQAFASWTEPGITRGEHFHLGKIERFLVVGGDATIRVRRLFEERIHEFQVSGTRPSYIDMPTLHTHNITNTGDAELLTLFWSHEIFDPQFPDTFAEAVTNGLTLQ